MASWKSLSPGQKMAVTVSVSAGAAALYIYYTKYWNKRDSQVLGPTNEDVELHITVPQEAAKLLVGRGGSIRKRLKNQTDAHIEINEASDSTGERELTIKGTASQVCQAKEVVHGILQERAVFRVELLVPARCVCRIIGQGGDQIQAICKSSGAKIQCEKRSSGSAQHQTRRMTVTGTKEQIEAAKVLIQKVSSEDESLQQRAAESSAFRCRRKEIIAVKKSDAEEAGEKKEEQPAENINESVAERSEAEQERGDTTYGDRNLSRTRTPSCDSISDITYEVSKFEVPSPDFTFKADEYVDVYVSATENPAHFWIQILGSRSSQLDKLTTEMSEHYEKQQQRRDPPEFQVGDIVAAPFHTDAFWYRAEVLGFLDNGKVDLYYVDYGDSWDAAQEYLFPLRSDFLSLPFQAIECTLSGIAPAGGKWTKDALDKFDDLAYCAQWKPLLAKICSFPSPGVSHCFQVKLYDPSTDPSLDIGTHLVRLGYAEEVKQSPVQADDDDKLVARLVEEVTSLSMDLEKGSFASHKDETQLALDISFDLLRSDVEPAAASCVEPPSRLMSTPLSHTRASTEEVSLEESIAKIKIISEEGEPNEVSLEADVLETTPHSNPSDHSSILSSTSSAYSKDSSSSSSSTSKGSSTSPSSSSEGQSSQSTALDDSSVYSPRGCFYYLSSEEVSTSTGFNSSTCEIITISSESEDEQPQPPKAPRSDEALLSSDSDDDVILVEP
ncbi:tudor and KH domain-containing protein isoform 2-T2 [Discoglossus pictus]